MSEPTAKQIPEIETLQSELAAAENRVRLADAEFQEFVSRVSHDLREPLRTVAAYCQLLAAKNRNPDEDAVLYVRYIMDGVERAQSLLAAMVEYATALPDRRRPVPVDMNAVLLEALKRVPAPEGSVTQDSLPTVIG